MYKMKVPDDSMYKTGSQLPAYQLQTDKVKIFLRPNGDIMKELQESTAEQVYARNLKTSSSLLSGISQMKMKKRIMLAWIECKAVKSDSMAASARRFH